MATSTFAERRRQGLDGLRRVTFSENTNSSRLYDYSEDEDEEEQERALSELYGEAEEGGAGQKRKKEESDKDIAQELEQEEKKKIRKLRPHLLPSHLTSAEGLIRLPHELKQIKYKPRKDKKRDVVAAAVYSSNLINGYRNFCEDLFPSMAFEDVLFKIEQLGSKKEVKSFVQHMRDGVRNTYIENCYGREKAEQMLQEVDDDMAQRQNENNDMMETQVAKEGGVFAGEDEEKDISDGNVPPIVGDNVASEQLLSSVVTPTTSSDIHGNRDDEENEASFENDPSYDQDNLRLSARYSSKLTVSVGTLRPEEACKKLGPGGSNDEKGSDDEEEATFDGNSATETPQKHEASSLDKNTLLASTVIKICDEYDHGMATTDEDNPKEPVESSKRVLLGNGEN